MNAHTSNLIATARGLVAALVLGAGGVMLAGFAPAEPPAGEKAEKPAETQDLLIFRNGNVIRGKILSENTTTVTFEGTAAGIAFKTDYPKSEILEIKRAAKVVEEPKAPSKSDPVPAGAPEKAEADDAGEDLTKYYWIALEGTFGEEISQTPMRKAIQDAKSHKADVLIFHLNADWKDSRKDELPDDVGKFQEIFRVEDITPIFASEIPREWEKQPKIVFWVKQAMGGAAFLPMVAPNLYFHSEGRMGGLGDLGFMYDGVGDLLVRQKLRSAGLGHAEGWANLGGHPIPIVRAMSRMEYVLSVKFENGQPVFFEGMPSNPGEELLTDDGKDENADTVYERVSGAGNDVLTLNARNSLVIGMSKGTVDTRAELLSALSLDRGAKDVSNRSAQIMKDWANGLDNTKRRLRKLIDEYRRVEVEPPGEYKERTAARGKQLRILDEMKGLLSRWGEGLSGRWLYENNVPSETQINTIQESIRLDQLKDRK